MSDQPDSTTWQHIGALLATAAASLGIGRATKRDQIEDVVKAIQSMESTIGRQLSELSAEIKVLLDRGERIDRHWMGPPK